MQDEGVDIGATCALVSAVKSTLVIGQSSGVVGVSALPRGFGALALLETPAHADEVVYVSKRREA